MKKSELINCEGTVLECKIDRIENVSVNVYLYKEAGYLKFRPLLKDLYKYLLGCITLEDVLKTSKNIKVNNELAYSLGYPKVKAIRGASRNQFFSVIDQGFLKIIKYYLLKQNF